MANPTETTLITRSEDSAAPDYNMRPVTVLLGIVMGTVVSVASGLLLVCLIFWLLRDDYPRLSAEIPALIIATIMFTELSLFAALSFYGSLKSLPWRRFTMLALWLSVLLVGWYFWPA
jgi:hypothetical protein